MSHTNLVTHTGYPVRLGNRIGKGGEGEVFLIDGKPDLVAKLYTSKVRPTAPQKLRSLVQLGKPDLLRVAALPVATVHRGTPSAQVAGLLMPLVPLAKFKPIHFLYSPAHRKTEFPTADWRFLVHTARNIASAFNQLHAVGIVIGDVNHSNILVADNTDVRLIDCDSFQVTSSGTTYRCDVGVPEFTPPELQGRPFASIDRNEQHDGFGLAVLVFLLLFMGRHPFAGVFQGSGDIPLEKAIAEYRFAYGPDAARFQMKQPPDTLNLSVATAEVARLFSLAFSRSVRPSAKEWRVELESLEAKLKACNIDLGHAFPKTQTVCPWCELMGRGATNFFSTVAYSKAAPTSTAKAKAEDLWRAIASFALPSRTYHRPVVGMPAAVPLPKDVPARPPSWFDPPIQGSTIWLLIGLAFSMGIMLFVRGNAPPVTAMAFAGAVMSAVAIAIVDKPRRNQHAILVGKYKHEWAVRHSQLLQARSIVQITETEFLNKISAITRNYESKRTELHACYVKCANLDSDKHIARLSLESHARELQLAEYLDSVMIEEGNIAGIAAGRKAVLRSFGVETALDLTRDRILAIKGFADVRTNALLDWRAKIESAFRFDARKGVPPVKLAEFESRYESIRDGHLAKLQSGRREISALVSEASSLSDGIESKVLPLLCRLAQAEANMKIMSEDTT